MNSAAIESVASPVAKARGGRLWPTLVACALVGLAFALALWRQTDALERWTFESGRAALAARGSLKADAIVLRDSEGKPHRIFGGEKVIYVVDFIYTRCLTVCQALGSEFTQMQGLLQQSGVAPVRLLSISVDPSHDDAPALAAFGRLHRAEPLRWTISAPQDVAAGQSLRRQLGVIVIPDGTGGFVHNGDIHLIDGNGRLLALYGYVDWRAALTDAQRRASAGARP